MSVIATHGQLTHPAGYRPAIIIIENTLNLFKIVITNTALELLMGSFVKVI